MDSITSSSFVHHEPFKPAVKVAAGIVFIALLGLCGSVALRNGGFSIGKALVGGVGGTVVVVGGAAGVIKVGSTILKCCNTPEVEKKSLSDGHEPHNTETVVPGSDGNPDAAYQMENWITEFT